MKNEKEFGRLLLPGLNQTLYFGLEWFIVDRPGEMTSPVGYQLCLCMNTGSEPHTGASEGKGMKGTFKKEPACHQAHTRLRA